MKEHTGFEFTLLYRMNFLMTLTYILQQYVQREQEQVSINTLHLSNAALKKIILKNKKKSKKSAEPLYLQFLCIFHILVLNYVWW